MQNIPHDSKTIDALEEIRHDTGFFGHPKGVGALAAGNFFNSAAWGAFYAIMIYYLYAPYTHGLGFPQGVAAQMVTAMGACNGLFVIVGSWLADRVLGMQKSLIVGNLVKGIGFALLAIPPVSIEMGRTFAIIALVLLALPIMGASNASLTGQLYAKNDNSRRDAAFTIHQFVNTAAGLITPVLVAQLGMRNYHWGFAIAAACAFLYMLVIILTQHRFFGPLGARPTKPLAPGQFKKIAAIAFLVMAAVLGTIALLVMKRIIGLNGFLNVITSLTFLIPIGFLLNLFRQKDLTDIDRRHMRPFLKLFCAQILIGLGGTLLTSAIAIFIDQKINRQFFGLTIAPGSIPTIYTILGLIAGPIFVYLYTKTRVRDIPIVKKYALGILMCALTFSVLSIPTLLLRGQGPYSILWMVVYYIFMALSDQMVWPIGSSLVSKLSPAAYETQMQTAWGQAAAVANGIALVLFNFFKTADQQVVLFPIMAGVLLLAVLYLFINAKTIDKQMM